jgi:hypothetical protein
MIWRWPIIVHAMEKRNLLTYCKQIEKKNCVGKVKLRIRQKLYSKFNGHIWQDCTNELTYVKKNTKLCVITDDTYTDVKDLIVLGLHCLIFLVTADNWLHYLAWWIKHIFIRPLKTRRIMVWRCPFGSPSFHPSHSW